MKPTRENKYKKWLVSNVHICTPNIPYINALLDKFISSISAKGHLLDLTEDSIYEDMSVFTGKCNLTLDIFRSEVMIQSRRSSIVKSISLLFGIFFMSRFISNFSIPLKALSPNEFAEEGIVMDVKKKKKIIIEIE